MCFAVTAKAINEFYKKHMQVKLEPALGPLVRRQRAGSSLWLQIRVLSKKDPGLPLQLPLFLAADRCHLSPPAAKLILLLQPGRLQLHFRCITPPRPVIGSLGTKEGLRPNLRHAEPQIERAGRRPVADRSGAGSDAPRGHSLLDITTMC